MADLTNHPGFIKAVTASSEEPWVAATCIQGPDNFSFTVNSVEVATFPRATAKIETHANAVRFDGEESVWFIPRSRIRFLLALRGQLSLEERIALAASPMPPPTDTDIAIAPRTWTCAGCGAPQLEEAEACADCQPPQAATMSADRSQLEGTDDSVRPGYQQQDEPGDIDPVAGLLAFPAIPFAIYASGDLWLRFGREAAVWRWVIPGFVFLALVTPFYGLLMEREDREGTVGFAVGLLAMVFAVLGSFESPPTSLPRTSGILVPAAALILAVVAMAVVLIDAASRRALGLTSANSGWTIWRVSAVLFGYGLLILLWLTLRDCVEINSFSYTAFGEPGLFCLTS